jgi:uncharacterized protein with NRDE domain
MNQDLRKTSVVRMRNYGRIIQDMVQLATKEQDVEKQQAMVVYIAQCMRQKNAQWNKEQESGVVRLKEDIVALSNGVLSCHFPAFEEAMQKLAQRVPANMNNQKKKRK